MVGSPGSTGRNLGRGNYKHRLLHSLLVTFITIMIRIRIIRIRIMVIRTRIRIRVFMKIIIKVVIMRIKSHFLTGLDDSDLSDPLHSNSAFAGF